MARSAVLAGRTTADLVRNVFMVIAHHRGRASPWASASGPTSVCSSAAALVILLFAYALCWGFAVIGLSAPNTETAQVMVVPHPLPADSSPRRPSCRSPTMPGWLQAFAEHQPVTQVVERGAAR